MNSNPIITLLFSQCSICPCFISYVHK